MKKSTGNGFSNLVTTFTCGWFFLLMMFILLISWQPAKDREHFFLNHPWLFVFFLFAPPVLFFADIVIHKKARQKRLERERNKVQII